MMNFRKCLIELYRSGIHGKMWRLYQVTNEFKICTPQTPLGKCSKLDVNEVFLQGSSDAMLMAWNVMDAVNKREDDFNDPIFTVEGIKIPRTLFADGI